MSTYSVCSIIAFARARGHFRLDAAAVYNDTLYDSSENESNPESSGLEREHDDEDQFIFFRILVQL